MHINNKMGRGKYEGWKIPALSRIHGKGGGYGDDGGDSVCDWGQDGPIAADHGADGGGDADVRFDGGSAARMADHGGLRGDAAARADRVGDGILRRRQDDGADADGTAASGGAMALAGARRMRG